MKTFQLLSICLLLSQFLYALDWEHAISISNYERKTELLAATVDKHDHTYVMTKIAYSSDDSVKITKLGADLTPIWERNLGCFSKVISIKTDGNGGLYILGCYIDSHTIGSQTITTKGWSDVLLVKLTEAGSLEWVRTAGSESQDYASGLVCTKDFVAINGRFNGASIISGSLLGNNVTGSDGRFKSSGFLMGFDSEGNEKFCEVLMRGSTDDYFYAIHLTNQKEVILPCYSRSALQVGDIVIDEGGKKILLLKFDQQGKLISYVANHTAEKINTMAIDPDNNHILYSKGKILKINALGETVWAKDFNRNIGNLKDISADIDGNVFVAVTLDGSSGRDESRFSFFKLSPNGIVTNQYIESDPVGDCIEYVDQPPVVGPIIIWPGDTSSVINPQPDSIFVSLAANVCEGNNLLKKTLHYSTGQIATLGTFDSKYLQFDSIELENTNTPDFDFHGWYNGKPDYVFVAKSSENAAWNNPTRFLFEQNPCINFEYKTASVSDIHFSLEKALLFDSVVWVFGDGQYSREWAPHHIYSIDGAYTVTATLYNTLSGIIAIVQEQINVSPNLQSETILLHKGLNYVSLNYTPVSSGTTTILKELVDKKQLITIKGFDSFYTPEKMDYFNRLTALRSHITYQITVNEDTEFTYNGVASEQSSLHLKKGWNLITVSKPLAFNDISILDYHPISLYTTQGELVETVRTKGVRYSGEFGPDVFHEIPAHTPFFIYSTKNLTIKL